MIKPKKLTALIALLLSTQSAHAIMYGEEVTADEYQDFMVKLTITKSTSGSTASCGGGLIGDKYLITAAHCVGEIASYSPYTYDFYVDNGVDNSITIYNSVNLTGDGVKKYDRTYTIVKHVGETTEDEANEYAIHLAILEVTKTLYPDVEVETSMDDADEFVQYHRKDIVVLELNEAIPYSTGALIGTFFDLDTTSLNIPYASTFNTQGWGYTTNGGSSSNVMLKTTQMNTEYNRGSLSALYTLGGDLCTTETTQTCYMHYDDDYELAANTETGSIALPGDSGTPNLYNGQWTGVTSTYNQYSLDANNFAAFDYYIDEVREAINQITFPNAITEEVAASDTTTHTFSIPVQNFTDSDVDMNPSVTLSDDTISYELSNDCDSTTLLPNQGCTLTLELNGDATPLTADFTATIALNDNDGTEIPVSLTIVDTDGDGVNDADDAFPDDATETTDTDGDGVGDNSDYYPTDATKSVKSSSSGGSSGGSMGWVTLFGLLALTLRRFKAKM